jgi:hypothetical protein
VTGPSTITVDELIVGDEPEAWRAAGFTVDDDGTCRVGHVRIRLVGRGQGKRIRSWSLRGVDTDVLDGDPTGGDITNIDGIPTTTSNEPWCDPADHANGALIIDHIVLVTPDQQRTIARFEAVDLHPRRTRQTDTYGAPFLQTFFRAGEVILELIGPEAPGGDGPAGFFGLAFTVADLDATAALLGAGLGDVKDAVQPGRRIGTLRHKQFDMSVATAFMSPGPDALGASAAAGDPTG